MSKDNELFDLCKEVYKRTVWDKSETDDGYDWNQRYIYEDYPSKGKCGTVSRDDAAGYHQHKNFIVAPLYTSDYLLEKLPASIKSKEYPGKVAFLWTRKDDDSLDKYPEGRISYFAWYFVIGVVDGVSEYGEYANTPLKALLKLVIALDDAGELK